MSYEKLPQQDSRQLAPAFIDTQLVDIDHLETKQLLPHQPEVIDVNLPLHEEDSFSVTAEIQAADKRFLIIDVRNSPTLTLDGRKYKSPNLGTGSVVADDAEFLIVSDEYGVSRNPNNGSKAVRKGEVVTIGRSHYADRFDYPDSVSRNHFSVSLNEQGDLSVTDMDSTNHTKLVTKASSEAAEEELAETTKPNRRVVSDDKILDQGIDGSPEVPEAEHINHRDYSLIDNAISEINHLKRVKKTTPEFTQHELESRALSSVGSIRSYVATKEDSDSSKQLMNLFAAGLAAGSSIEYGEASIQTLLNGDELSDPEKVLLGDFMTMVWPLQHRLRRAEIPQDVVDSELYRGFFSLINRLDQVDEPIEKKGKITFAAAGVTLGILEPDTGMQDGVLKQIQQNYLK